MSVLVGHVSALLQSSGGLGMGAGLDLERIAEEKSRIMRVGARAVGAVYGSSVVRTQEPNTPAATRGLKSGRRRQRRRMVEVSWVLGRVEVSLDWSCYLCRRVAGWRFGRAGMRCPLLRHGRRDGFIPQ
jgi:hypothetical protein